MNNVNAGIAVNVVNDGTAVNSVNIVKQEDVNVAKALYREACKS